MKNIRLVFAVIFIILLTSCNINSENLSANTIPISVSTRSQNSDIKETTSSSTIKPSIFPTSIITDTPPTITTDSILGESSGFITIVKLGGEGIVHVDLETGITVEVDFQDGINSKVLGFYDEYTLIMKLGNQIVKIDLSGNILEELFLINKTESEFLYLESVSPNKEWVAYTLGQGYYGYDRFEIQNIKIMNTESEVFNVTINGGGWIGEWSHDSSELAYSDLDENGNPQLFIYNLPEKRRTQITTFTEEVQEIRKIRWSQDDQQMLIRIYTDELSDQLVLLDNIDTQPEEKRFTGFTEIREFWWVNRQEVIFQAKHEGDFDERGLFIVNVSSMQVVDQVIETHYGNQPFILAKPLNSPELVGFFFEGFFHIYDFNLKQMYQCSHVQKNFDIFELFPSPFIESPLEHCDEFFPN